MGCLGPAYDVSCPLLGSKGNMRPPTRSDSPLGGDNAESAQSSQWLLILLPGLLPLHPPLSASAKLNTVLLPKQLKFDSPTGGSFFSLESPPSGSPRGPAQTSGSDLK